MKIIFPPNMHAKASLLFLWVCGFAVIALAVHETFTGKVYVRFYGWVPRTDAPKTYWWNLVLLYLLGLFLIGECLRSLGVI